MYFFLSFKNRIDSFHMSVCIEYPTSPLFYKLKDEDRIWHFLW